MSKDIYRYEFKPDTSIEDIEASLLLAILASQSLHGETQVCLDAAHFLDTAKRACIIDAGTEVGRDINRLFAGFIMREFGEDSFKVSRVDKVVEGASLSDPVAV
jgi:hypothetical protein